jgi:prolyl oligopeptidase
MAEIDVSANADPFVWLEEMDSARVRSWVEARNDETRRALCDAQFEQDRATLLHILNAPDRIPWIVQRGAFVYNFWQDAQNPKGLWRRTTPASYATAVPDWNVILDIDALAKAEGEDWVWRGCITLPPPHRLGLVQLSRGGADAVVIREFDLDDRRFVSDGFFLPEAKGGAAWLDTDTLLVSTTLGGESFQTVPGYARTVRRWRRGTPFDTATTVFECERHEMNVWAWREHSPTHPRTCFMRRYDFFRYGFYVDDGSGNLRRVEIPDDAYLYIERNYRTQLACDQSAHRLAGRRAALSGRHLACCRYRRPSHG